MRKLSSRWLWSWAFVGWLCAAPAQAETFHPDFFAFQNGLNLPPVELAATLKELGYDGLSTEGYAVRPYQEALKTRGLRLFNTYLSLNLDFGQKLLTEPIRNLMDDLNGTGSAIWLSIPQVTRDGQSLAQGSRGSHSVAFLRLMELAEYAESRGVRIALYPHAGCWLERVSDAVRLADAIHRSSVGVTFNLCHWLKVEGDLDPTPALQSALPRLFFVSINGADGGETKGLDWKQLIQPLDSGSYDVTLFLQRLKHVGYHGPVGLQGYGIPGDPVENARRSMAAWRKKISTINTMGQSSE